MTNLLAARSQMAISLGFHIIFAAIGMTMPFFMSVAHWKWLRTGDETYHALTKAWSKGVAMLFATGAVSGTVLSFELGLLWPGFMEKSGAVIGMPFSWEGTAFFVEAIAIGVYLYGWNRLPKWTHWACGLVVGIAGVVSGIFVTCANAWMNAPTGFDWVNGEAINIDPFKAMFNPAWLQMGLHMTIAAFQATGFGVAGIHAFLYLRNRHIELHKRAMIIALVFGAVASLIMPFSGDVNAKSIAKRQPEKLAAMEAHFHTGAKAPIWIGGIPNEKNRSVRYGIKIPGILSFLSFGNFDAVVAGLEEFPEDEWPPVAIVHSAFQIMVGIGFLLAAVSLLFIIFRIRKKQEYARNWFLWILTACIPLGFIAIEAGWVVTEVGRQPWIIYRILKTADTVTPMPGVVAPMVMFSGVYLLLAVVVTWLMARQIRKLHEDFGAKGEVIGPDTPE
ncbi:MAG: cytochrome ubiquinol oxidase subunit I [Chitinivibrionales bacterium]|nr:cytochrome ubiquinol oxidase subunit I [Chitinivibrionales bacterium]